MALPAPSIDRIAALLDERFGLDALWLFGSEAHGRARADSDVDLAALFRVRPSLLELLDARADLALAIDRDVDLVDLGRASPILAMQVLKTGRLLVDPNPARRISFVARAPGLYEDVKRIRRPAEQALIRRLLHGGA